MLDGTFITVTSFKNFQGKAPFVIGAVLLCAKEPKNTYDTEAIKVFSKGGQAAGYVAQRPTGPCRPPASMIMWATCFLSRFALRRKVRSSVRSSAAI